MGLLRITQVYFPKGLPTVESILRELFTEASIQAQLSIDRITDRKAIDELNTASSSPILNEEIIHYTLWKEGYNAVDFSLIKESHTAYIDVTDAATKTLRDALIYTLVCLGGIAKDIQ